MGKVDQWNPNLYDEQHSFVSNYGSSLIDVLQPKKGEVIVDLGCGTGDLAYQIAQVGATVIGIDQSENMIGQAKKKFPSIEFHVEDATTLNFKKNVDAVFSNATLHWVQPPDKALQCIYNSLKIGGRFVAEFGGKGNVKTITNELINEMKKSGIPNSEQRFPWYYPSVGEYTSLMEQVGFRVTYAIHYDRPTILKGEDGLKNWIQMFGGALLEDIDAQQKETIISNVVSTLKPTMFDGENWTADYKRIRVVGMKECY